MACSWGVNPQEIRRENVAAKAALLVDQYRKKAELTTHCWSRSATKKKIYFVLFLNKKVFINILF
jgi:hypothetical protein